jgi:Domain of unknown function (DUF4412)
MRMLLATALLAAGVASAEDLTIVASLTRNGQPAGTQTSYLSADKIRMAQADGQEFMLDAASGNMTTIDTKKKQYSVVTPQDLQAMMTKMQEQARKIDEQMKNMPPQARAMMEKLGGSGMTVEKTGPSRTVAGLSCETWTMTFGEIAKTEQCLSKAVAVPTQAWTRYREFAEQMQAMLRSMGRAKGLDDLKEKMQGMEGFPLATTTTAKFLGKSQSSASEVTEIRKGPIPASAFEIPAGFKQVASPMQKMLK